jgi:hypothetical protein
LVKNTIFRYKSIIGRTMRSCTLRGNG